MKHYKYLFMSVACFCLLGLISLTYSKFTYSKEVSGSLVTTVPPIPLYSVLSSKSSTLDTNVDFGSASSSTNGEGLMMMSSTQSDTYPILYYRGDVSDNNVIYGGFCWLIVRTTETGGVKLIYNGEVNADGSCNNSSGVGGEIVNISYTDAFPRNTVNEFNINNKSLVFLGIEEDNWGNTDVYIGNTQIPFNDLYDSPVYTGYMYNDDTTYDVTTAEGKTNYKSHLADTSILDNATGRYTQNKYDSIIKGVIDDWYEENILGKPFESLLEDTVWCNDRSVTSTTYTIDNYSSNKYLAFSAYTRLYENTPVTPSLVCNRDVDKFTVDRTKGNGDLDYPIGLLTADEINLAGHPYGSQQTTYLTLPIGNFWSLSPECFYQGHVAHSFVDAGGLGGINGGGLSGARPSVSLSNSATVSDGDGSFAKPYIVG